MVEKIMKHITFAIVLLLLWCGSGWGATYYMRADGTAANKAAASGGCGTVGACMNVTIHNGETFSPGDTIYLCDDGGDYVSTITVPSSGSGAGQIAYTAYTGDTPVINGADGVTTWTVVSGSIYRAELVTEPDAVIYNDSLLAQSDGNFATLASNTWDWVNDTTDYLYVNVGEDPDNGTLEVPVRAFGIDISENDYITIDGITIKGVYEYGINGDGSTSGTNDSDNCIVRNCEIYNLSPGIIGGANPGAIILGRYADGWTVSNNELHDINVCYFYDDCSSTTHQIGSAIYIGATYEGGHSHPSNNSTFSNNTIYNTATAITAKYDSVGNTITKNVIHDVTKYGITVVSNATTGNTVSGNLIYDVGTYLTDTAIAINCYNRDNVYYNIIHTGEVGIYINANGINESETNNTESGDNNNVYNNTIYGMTTGIKLANVGALTCTGNTFKNNIIAECLRQFRVNDAYDGSDCDEVRVDNTFDYNLYYDSSALNLYIDDGSGCGGADGNNTFAQWKTISTQDASAVNSDPLFISTTDYRLKGGSPAINAGSNLGASYDDALDPRDIDGFPYNTVDQDSYGAGWEIGAFAHRGYLSGIVRYSTGTAITGSGNDAYIKCYGVTGTGNDIRADDNAPIAVDTSDTSDGSWYVVGTDTGTTYFCTFGFYDSTPIAGAEYMTAQ